MFHFSLFLPDFQVHIAVQKLLILRFVFFYSAEKRPGILKCQSSTEKIDKGTKSLTASNRGHRNVALQAIINKNTEETKQVIRSYSLIIFLGAQFILRIVMFFALTI